MATTHLGTSNVGSHTVDAMTQALLRSTELEKYVAKFDEYDIDGTGSLDVGELTTMLEGLGVSTDDHSYVKRLVMKFGEICESEDDEHPLGRIYVGVRFMGFLRLVSNLQLESRLGCSARLRYEDNELLQLREKVREAESAIATAREGLASTEAYQKEQEDALEAARKAKADTAARLTEALSSVAAAKARVAELESALSARSPRARATTDTVTDKIDDLEAALDAAERRAADAEEEARACQASAVAQAQAAKKIMELCKTAVRKTGDAEQSATRATKALEDERRRAQRLAQMIEDLSAELQEAQRTRHATEAELAKVTEQLATEAAPALPKRRAPRDVPTRSDEPVPAMPPRSARRSTTMRVMGSPAARASRVPAAVSRQVPARTSSTGEFPSHGLNTSADSSPMNATTPNMDVSQFGGSPPASPARPSPGRSPAGSQSGKGAGTGGVNSGSGTGGGGGQERPTLRRPRSDETNRSSRRMDDDTLDGLPTGPPSPSSRAPPTRRGAGATSEVPPPSPRTMTSPPSTTAGSGGSAGGTPANGKADGGNDRSSGDSASPTTGSRGSGGGGGGGSEGPALPAGTTPETVGAAGPATTQPTATTSTTSTTSTSTSTAATPTAEAAAGFDAEDEENNPFIVKTFSEEEGRMVVRAGSEDMLVAHLTQTKGIDLNYKADFMLTYRSFISPLDLLTKLIARFNAAQEGTVVAIRVFDVLKYWVTEHFSDFAENTESLLPMLEEFVATTLKDTMKNAALQLERILNKQKSGALGLREQAYADPLTTSFPEPERMVSFADLDAEEVARQMTILEHGLFRSIKPIECVGKRWSKNTDDAPHIIALAKRFNMVSNWVASEVISAGSSVRARSAVMRKFIKVAMALRALNNFNGMLEVLSGLHSAAVNRLKKTWSSLPRSVFNTYKELDLLTANANNYQHLRGVLLLETPPCTPYLGMYLTDLTFIEDGMNDTAPNLDGTAELINFSKLRKISVVIRHIQIYQNACYDLEPIPELQWYFSNLPSLTQDEMYSISLKVEPRKR